jgi:DNA-binding transcriptional LysR family regulator
VKNLELRQLEYFIAVAEERNFGRAAERLRIAQPGLSQQIRALERQLEVTLFTRHSRGADLTASGETLLEQARVVVEAASRAVETTRRAQGGKRSLLRIGTHVLGSPPFVTELLRTFEAHFPEVRLETRPGLALQSLDALSRRVVDVAIVPAPIPPMKDVRYLRLGEAEIFVALPEGHRLAPMERIPRSELLEETFFAWPRRVNPTLIDHLHHSIFGETGHPGSVEVDELTNSDRLQLVAEGKGIVMVVGATAAEHAQGVVFRRFEDPPPSLETGLAWFDLHASPFVPAFVDLARELSGSVGPAAVMSGS